jgi:hypothetical protein
MEACAQKFTISKIKGNVTPLFVFEHLRDNQQENHIVIIDDCDIVFTDNQILNVLKACLESGNKKRIVTWGSTRGEKEK